MIRSDVHPTDQYEAFAKLHTDEEGALAALSFLLRAFISFGRGHFDVQSFVVARNLLKSRSFSAPSTSTAPIAAMKPRRTCKS